MRDALTSTDQRYVVLRFLVVGGSLTLAYSVLSSILALALNMPAAIASAVGYALCIPGGYLAQRNVAFRANAPHARAAPRYVLLQAPLLALGALLSWLFVTMLHWHEAVAFFVVGPTVAAVSFFAQKLWTFAQR